MAKKFPTFSIAQNIIFTTLLIVVISLLTLTIIETLTFSSTTLSIVEDTSKEINKQVIMNYENYIDSVINTANYIQQKTNEYGLSNRSDELDEVYANAASIQQDIEAIVLLDITGNVVVSSTTKEINNADLTLLDWYQDAISDPTIYHFSSPHIQDILEVSHQEVITVTKVVDYYIGRDQYTGILLVDLNTFDLVRLSEMTNLGENGHIIILNKDNSLVYSSLDDCIDSTCESSILTQEIIFGGRSVTVDGISMYANVNTLVNTRWRIATFVNVDIIDQTRITTMYITGGIFVVTLLLTGVIATFISRRISRPIYKLQKHMQLVETGNLHEKINIVGQKEVVDLGHSFNKMQDEIVSLMDAVLKEQKEKRKSEFKALQTQINPHFLYNTLDSIVYLSENEMNDKVQEMVIALSKFFRISISRGKNIIPVKEELEHAKNYLLIQQIRYNEKFDFRFEVEEETHDLVTVKLLLQPLIENAIYHGINTEYDNGMIVIRSYIENEKLVLEVEDDGYGIPQEKIDELYKHMRKESKQNSVGLINVYQRLKIYFGDEADFIIESELDEKTVFKLIMPIERVIEDETK
jgi:two-component system sensor histidine kinase YesM